MAATQGNVELLARCGLYCGECGAFRKGRCKGCRENVKATWCKVRACCNELGWTSCADCADASDPADCRKFNNIISKLFGLIFRSDRRKCILRLREVGPQAFTDEMAAAGRQSMRR